MGLNQNGVDDVGTFRPLLSENKIQYGVQMHYELDKDGKRTRNSKTFKSS